MPGVSGFDGIAWPPVFGGGRAGGAASPLPDRTGAPGRHQPLPISATARGQGRAPGHGGRKFPGRSPGCTECQQVLSDLLAGNQLTSSRKTSWKRSQARLQSYQAQLELKKIACGWPSGNTREKTPCRGTLPCVKTWKRRTACPGLGQGRKWPFWRPRCAKRPWPWIRMREKLGLHPYNCSPWTAAR